MNNKGFTLVELIVSFVLITVISLALFKTTLTLQQQQQINLSKNKYKTFLISLNNTIQMDFMGDKVKSITSCGNNCYDIVYENVGEKRLSVDSDNNIITYGSTKEKLPSDYKFIGNIEFNSYTSDRVGYDSFILLTISIKNSYDSKIDKIKYMYQYDSENGAVTIS